MHKKQQNSADSARASGPADQVNRQIGLTALQEKCAVLLAAGTSISDAAIALKLDRGTIYCWKKKVTFTCYLNRLQEEAKEILQGSLFDMQALALQALKEALTSSNEATKLKAATWLLERLALLPIGETEPKQVIKGLCTETAWQEMTGPHLNKRKFEEMLIEEGLEP